MGSSLLVVLLFFKRREALKSPALQFFEEGDKTVDFFRGFKVQVDLSAEGVLVMIVGDVEGDA